ncbi:MAG: hypothetical protein AB1757_14990 [Acidobacteriota bacterium]
MSVVALKVMVSVRHMKATSRRRVKGMTSNHRLSVLSLVLVIFLCAMPLKGQKNTRQTLPFLPKYFGFSATNIKALEQGKIVTKLPNTSDKREVAALGAMRLNVTKEYFLERFIDIESFKKNAMLLQLHRFSDPPRLEDMRELTLEAEHLAALRKCIVGDCGVKIPAPLIERFRKEMNWSAANSKQQATTLMKQFLLDYVRAYLSAGNKALVEYSDQQYPQRLNDEVRSLLEQSPYLLETAPAFHKYLDEFPLGKPPVVENILYWSKEKIKGYKVVLSITHVTIYKPTDASQILIASKQIYANHYFEASLALTWVVDAEIEAGKKGSYLIYFNRSRMDALRGGWNWLKRYIANRKIRYELVKNLQLAKEKLEGASVNATP